MPADRMKTPRLVLSVARAARAPAAPNARALTRLFKRALALVPQGERSQAAGGPAAGSAKLARRWVADVHIVSDARIAYLNATHMKVHGPTDVLAFSMGELDPERRAFNCGEIVVSFETAQREAAGRGIPLEEELSRYCLHGFLHLLGYDDHGKSARKAMFQVQERALCRRAARRSAGPPLHSTRKHARVQRKTLDCGD